MIVSTDNPAVMFAVISAVMLILLAAARLFEVAMRRNLKAGDVVSIRFSGHRRVNRRVLAVTQSTIQVLNANALAPKNLPKNKAMLPLRGEEVDEPARRED